VPGLPIVDELYFEAPSIRLGSWLGFHTRRIGVPFINLVAGESDIVTTPVIGCDSLAEALTQVQAEGKGQPKGTYYYRGQVGRRYLQCACEMTRLAQSFPNMRRPTFKFESFLPSAFRGYITRPPRISTPIIRWPPWIQSSPLAGVGPVVRALMQSGNDDLRIFVLRYFSDVVNYREIISAQVLAARGMALANRLPADLLAPGTNVLNSLLTLVSWAQHYEFGSIMVDISSSPAVAAWFASHRWSGELAKDDDGEGVIYRFDYREIRRFLDKELEAETSAAPRIRALGFLGLTDIADLPASGGKRPSAQHGGSFLGLENIVIAYLFSIYKALKIYTFPLHSLKGDESGYTKQDLCPEDDVALKIFPPPGTSHDPLTSAEVKHFVDCEDFSREQQEFLVRAFDMALL